MKFEPIANLFSLVMAGLDPAIHVSRLALAKKSWIPGTRPGMTEREWP
jgi:hypothetical protein